MKLASFNVENLFARPRVFHRGDWEQGRPVLEAFSKTAALLEEPTYTPSIKAQIINGLTALGLAKSDENKFVILRQNRSKFVKRGGGQITIEADGRAHWVGYLELKKQLVSETCVQNTARVVSELNPDVIAVVEADDRPSLLRFGNEFVPAAIGPGSGFDYVMLIDGNDDRGIDVGLMTRPGYAITDMRSHVNETALTGGPLFSRDCAEYVVRTPKGSNLLVLVNHLKSKGYGSTASSNAKRLAQATRVAEIYTERKQDYPYVAVVGDMNDTPGSAQLKPLFDAGLRDISQHPNYQDDGIPGTWGAANAGNKLDYIFLSPSLFNRVTGGGVFRHGVWDERKTPKWQAFETIKGPNDAASDHAAIWAEATI